MPTERTRDRINPELTRRRFLQGTAFAGVAAFLAACTNGTAESNPPASVSIPTPPPVSTTFNAALLAVDESELV